MLEEGDNSARNLRSYKEINDCLQFIDAALRCPVSDSKSNFDVAVVRKQYERCDELIKKIISDEPTAIWKDTLHELANTLEWQKETLRLISDRRSSPANTSKCRGGASIDSTENRTGSKESDSRRQMVLSTLVVDRKLSLNDVAGLKEAKQVLGEAMITPMRFPHLFSGVRKSWTRILMYGPPGTGKSRLALAVSSEVESKFFSVSSADLMSSWFGESEKMVKELFQCARESDGSSLIFIDEIDSICRRRTCSEDEQVRRVKTELLKQMDGIDNGIQLSRVFLLCATNCPWELDPAFLRRFQKRIYIPLPDRQSRLELLRIHTGEMTAAFTDTDWRALLDKTEGFSGSDIATLTMAALLVPIKELHTSTHWIRSSDGKVVPCSAFDRNEYSLQSKLEYLPPNKVIPREVKVNDFLAVLNTSQRTVSSQDLHRFEEFTRQYGQIG